MEISNALFSAIRAKNVKRVREILELNPDLVNIKEQNTIYPLHTAVIEGSGAIVQLLLEFNADIEAIYEDRKATPLDCAIVYGKKDAIRILIENQANLDGKLNIALRGQAGEFEKFVELPSKEEYTEIVEFLKSLGVEN